MKYKILYTIRCSEIIFLVQTCIALGPIKAERFVASNNIEIALNY